MTQKLFHAKQGGFDFDKVAVKDDTAFSLTNTQHFAVFHESGTTLFRNGASTDARYRPNLALGS